MTHPNPTPVNPEPAYQTRVERPAERRGARNDAPGWVLGAILIVVGLVLMAQNFGIDTFDNWWALFILLPAAGSFASAWRTYQATGSWSGATGSLIGGVFFTLLALYFLIGFSLNWTLIGPLFLIGGGLLLLVAAMRK